MQGSRPELEDTGAHLFQLNMPAVVPARPRPGQYSSPGVRIKPCAVHWIGSLAEVGWGGDPVSGGSLGQKTQA